MTIRHLIFDLNGTLANTKLAFVRTRHALIARLCRLTGTPRDVLLEQCRDALRGNSLNPDLAFALPSVLAWIDATAPGRAARANAIAREVARFRLDVAHRHQLAPEVEDALVALRARDARLSVWSGSRAPYVVDMFLLLGLDGLIDTVFCPAQIAGVRTSLDHQRLRHTQLVELGAEVAKPSPDTLRRIVADVGVSEDHTALVGNNPVGDGASTLGTRVRFIRLDRTELDADDIARADDLTGQESAKRAAQAGVDQVCATAAFRAWSELAALLS